MLNYLCVTDIQVSQSWQSAANNLGALVSEWIVVYSLKDCLLAMKLLTDFRLLATNSISLAVISQCAAVSHQLRRLTELM